MPNAGYHNLGTQCWARIEAALTDSEDKRSHPDQVRLPEKLQIEVP